MSIPLFVIGFSMIWILMLASLVPIKFVYIFGAICFALLLLSLTSKRTRENVTVPVVLATVVLSCALFSLKYNFDYLPTVSHVGEICEIKGTVTEVESKSDSGSNRYIVKVKEGPLKGHKLRLSSKYSTCDLYDEISFKGKVYLLDYKSKGVYVGAYPTGDIEIESFDGKTFDIGTYVENELKCFLPSDYALVLKGMLIGDKSNLPDDIYEKFQKVGIVHLLAVSGFHTSLWSMIIYRALLKNGISRKFSAGLCIVFIIFFLGLTGFSKSTIRASLMLIIFFGGRMTKRQNDSKNSLGLAAIIVLLINPFAGADVGFLLSFFATLGILTLSPSMQKYARAKLKKWIKNYEVRQKVESLVTVVFVSISAFAFTLPIIMLFIGELSLVSPLSNLLTTTLAGDAILLSGIAIVLSKIPILSTFENPLLLLSGLIVKYTLFMSDLLLKIPFCSVDISENFMVVTISAIMILIGSSFILNADKRKTAILSTLILTASIITHYLV